MNLNSPEQTAGISISAKGKAPKKRTIKECANVLSSCGDLLDYEKHSGYKYEFHINVRPAKFLLMVDRLKQLEHIENEFILEGSHIEELSYLLPARLNVRLTFV